jgi:hypothetical protein
MDSEKKTDKKFKFNLPIILSVCAIILTQTQFYPLYTFFAKPKIEYSIATEMTFNHRYGHLYVDDWVQIRNSGDEREYISKVYLYIKKVGRSKYRKALRMSYFYQMDFNRTYLYPYFGTYYAPDWITSSKYKFIIEKDKDDQEYQNALDKKIYKQISEKTSDLNIATIDDTLNSEINAYVKKNMEGFTIGEYNAILISYNSKNELINPDRYYSFTIFDTDIEVLKETTEDYKYGRNGIYSYSNKKGFGFTTNIIPYENENPLQILINEADEFIKRNVEF